ncbi:sodium-translocating pyrophosphatase [Coprothermobacteraceae bacterium]|nr:sodium-translocating pyrophosphatase [Coprothermobacteraceae bacterium]
MAVFFGAAALLLLSVLVTSQWVMGVKLESDRAREISGYIKRGAQAFLRAEYRTILPWTAVLFLILTWLIGYAAGIAFALGALFSIGAGFIGMQIATSSNARTTEAARKSAGAALLVAFSAGSVMGMTVVAFGLVGLGLVAFAFGGFKSAASIMSSFSLGASFVALFARVGGGIYTKAADVGADLVGKIEANIPEDDPRNPAVIADNVGDNVGDVAGMGADLYESYVGSIVAAILLAVAGNSELGLNFTLWTVGVGALAGWLAIILVRFLSAANRMDPANVFRTGSLFVTATAVLLISAVGYLLKAPLGFVVATVGGMIVGIAVGFITDYYTMGKPVKEIAKASQTGTATNILSGMATAMESTFLPVLLVGLATIVAYWSAGLFGIALAGVGMLSTLAFSLSVDAYGPVADNAGGIAEMAHFPHEVRGVTDTLDALGNTTAAMGKGFAIASAALTALALFAAFKSAVGLTVLDVTDPKVLAGMMVGASAPFLFSSVVINAVSRTAFAMVLEVRRQFKEIPGLLSGQAVADYDACISISTVHALRNMVAPALLALIVPVVSYFVLGTAGVGGVLIGQTVSGFLLAVFMANAGGAWDNAKKLIESGFAGGKGSEAHRAAVIGDTVGDPLKDTAGPSINILMKLSTVVSLILIPIFVRMGLPVLMNLLAK